METMDSPNVCFVHALKNNLCVWKLLKDQNLWIMIPALYIYCIKVEVLKTLSHFIFSNGSR